MTLKEITGSADRILQGKVVSAAAAYESAGRIWTTYQIDAVDKIKGIESSINRIEIKQPGGTVGEFTTQAPGIPHFIVGDEYVLFSKDFGAHWQSVLNGPQGALRVKKEQISDAGGAAVERKTLPGLTALFKEAQNTEVEAFKLLIRQTLADVEAGK